MSRKFAFNLLNLAALASVVTSAQGNEKGQPTNAKTVDESSACIQLTDVARPFELSELAQRQLYDVLNLWEERSLPIRSFRCKFTRWKYDRVFGDSIAHGDISYEWPSKASFRVKEPTQERWERNEKAIYEFDYSSKVMTEHPLADDMIAKEIDSWPIPLLYRVCADDLNREYWIRCRVDDAREDEIRLEFHPRQRPVGFRSTLSAAMDVSASGYLGRYRRLSVILNAKTMIPTAVAIYGTHGDQTSYAFTDIEVSLEAPCRTISSVLSDLLPSPLPPGWNRTVLNRRE